MKPSDKITANGTSKTISEFAAALGCPVQTILGRLARGWPVDRAVTEPAGDRGGKNRGAKAPAEVLTPDELQRLLDACNDGSTGIRNRALIVIGWRAGLRISEALALKPADLDPVTQTVRILHGKGDKARTVGLDGTAWKFVSAWSTARDELEVAATAPLFCTLTGGRLASRYVRELMPRLAKTAAIAKRVHFHGLRHTMAFELAGEGVPIHLIQQALGHASASVTSRYLAHLNPAETIAAMKGRSWGGTPAPSSAPKCTSVPVPGWLERLRGEIGDRLVLFHDAHQGEEFRAAVILF